MCCTSLSVRFKAQAMFLYVTYFGDFLVGLVDLNRSIRVTDLSHAFRAAVIF